MTESRDQEPPKGAGRPRDAGIDAKVLDATRELLMEVGWDDLSVRAVAARAGVGRGTIDRRWASKAELVLHSILGATPDLEPFDGTDRDGWIDWVVHGSRELFNRPEVRAAIPGLLNTFSRDENLRKQLWGNFSGPPTALFRSRSDDADNAGLDAHAILAMAAGAALFLSVIATDDNTEELYERMNQLLLRATRPD